MLIPQSGMERLAPSTTSHAALRCTTCSLTPDPAAWVEPRSMVAAAAAPRVLPSSGKLATEGGLLRPYTLPAMLPGPCTPPMAAPPPMSIVTGRPERCVSWLW